MLGQDTDKNGDNSLMQINLKDLDADSRNNTLNREPGQKIALKNNIEEGSNNYSLELDKKPEVSLSESRNYGAIKKFVGGERLPLDRNSSTAKDSRNFGKIREWSSQSREHNSSSPLEEKNAKQYDRAKEWIRKEGQSTLSSFEKIELHKGFLWTVIFLLLIMVLGQFNACSADVSSYWDKFSDKVKKILNQTHISFLYNI